MQTIHLMDYHLGGGAAECAGGSVPPVPLPDAGRPYVDSLTFDAEAKQVKVQARNARAGEVKNPVGEVQTFPIDIPPAPALPDAGKPYVEGVTYDKDAKRVRLRAQNERAGEVKEPVGEWQEFPIDVPEVPQLPAAGKAYADSCTYDHATRTVTVHARNAQAGEVKDPEGETRQFTIDVPAAPALPDAGRPYVEGFTFDATTKKARMRAMNARAGEVKTPEGDWQEFEVVLPPVPEQVTGVVYMYQVTNMSQQPQLVSADNESKPGEAYGAVSAHLEGDDGTNPPSMAPVYSYVKPFPEGIKLSLRPLEDGLSGTADYSEPSLYVNGRYLIIERQVTIT